MSFRDVASFAKRRQIEHVSGHGDHDHQHDFKHGTEGDALEIGSVLGGRCKIHNDTGENYYLTKFLMIGTANAKHIPLSPISYTDASGNSYLGPINGPGIMAGKIAHGATNTYLSVLPLSPTLGGLKLYIKSTRLMVLLADATDNITSLQLVRVTSGAPPTSAAFDTNATLRNSANTYDDNFGATPYDVSAFGQVGVLIRTVVATINELQFAAQLECYYGE